MSQKYQIQKKFRIILLALVFLTAVLGCDGKNGNEAGGALIPTNLAPTPPSVQQESNRPIPQTQVDSENKNSANSTPEETVGDGGDPHGKVNDPPSQVEPHSPKALRAIIADLALQNGSPDEAEPVEDSQPKSVCGNEACEAGEMAITCPQDCLSGGGGGGGKAIPHKMY